MPSAAHEEMVRREVEAALARERELATRFPGLTPEQRKAEMDRLERAQAEAKARSERAAREKERKDKEIRSLATTLHQAGRLAIALNWERLEFLDEKIIIPCPHCGQHIPWAAGYVIELVEMWRGAGGKKSDLIVRNLRNPLSYLVGAPAILESNRCRACNESVVFAAQLVIV